MIVISRHFPAAAAAVVKPIIGYHNLLEDSGAVIVGVPAAVVANAYDWLTYDYWTTNAAAGTITATFAEAKAADYFAFFGHTLADKNGTIKLQYKQGAGAWTDIPETFVTPGDTRPVFKTFDKIFANQWRVVIVCDAGETVNLAVVSFGEKLSMQRGAYVGVTPPPFARVDTILNSETQDGQFLGRSLIRTGISGSMDFDMFTAAWVRLSLNDFILHARTKGWFIAWYPTTYPDEVAYCWTSGTPQPNNTKQGRMGMSLAYEGRAE